MLNIYNIEPTNYVNGNGCRYVLWVQGCDLACVGCWNQPTWSFKENVLKSVDEIFEEIISLGSKIDGVTFSGGEPFSQATELAKLAEMIKGKTTLDIQIFSGFSKKELVRDGQLKLLKYTDILVAGRYDDTKENNNQTVYILNDNVDIWQFDNEEVQIEIDKNSDIKITGYPTDSLINEIKGLADARV